MLSDLDLLSDLKLRLKALCMFLPYIHVRRRSESQSVASGEVEVDIGTYIHKIHLSECLTNEINDKPIYPYQID